MQLTNCFSSCETDQPLPLLRFEDSKKRVDRRLQLLYPSGMDNFERVKRVIEYLSAHQKSQPSLEEISTQLGISPSHLHRLFSDWAGITPKSFLKCLTLEHARSMLKDNYSVLDTTLESGLSGPSRLHDLFVSIEAASPGEIKSGGVGLKIDAGFAESPFGPCLIAKSQRGICHMSFESKRSKEIGLEIVRAEWPNSELNWNKDAAKPIAKQLFVRSSDMRPEVKLKKLKAFVKGTDFQVRVWRALLRLPSGYLATYGNIAREIGNPHSSRAVGTAIGKNPIAFLIPCHRVIRSTGACGEYRWGSERKKAMIAWESV